MDEQEGRKASRLALGEEHDWGFDIWSSRTENYAEDGIRYSMGWDFMQSRCKRCGLWAPEVNEPMPGCNPPNIRYDSSGKLVLPNPWKT